jgi:heme-degrading monooxygenase HmoA
MNSNSRDSVYRAAAGGQIGGRFAQTWLGVNLSAMTTIGMHYEVVPGKEEEFERGFLGVIEHLKTVPGHVESHMYEDVANVGSYVILSEWENQEAFGAFMKSPEFAKVVAWGKAEILRSRPRHKIYQ